MNVYSWADPNHGRPFGPGILEKDLVFSGSGSDLNFSPTERHRKSFEAFSKKLKPQFLDEILFWGWDFIWDLIGFSKTLVVAVLLVSDACFKFLPFFSRLMKLAVWHKSETCFCRHEHARNRFETAGYISLNFRLRNVCND